MTPTRRFKALLDAPGLLLAPGAYDVLSARLAEQAGFGAVYMTGYGTSASVLGEPDMGLLSFSEMLKRADDMANAVDVPILADGDTGFGNALSVRRTVRGYEKAGVAGIQLEDQVFPKRCGHMAGKEVIPAEEMVQKIRAAVDARHDEDFVVVARTDARAAHGLAEALRRGALYREAGADVLFIESPEDVDELRQVQEAFRGTRTLANMVEGGRTPVLGREDLEALGFAIAIYPVGPLYAAAGAVRSYLDALLADGRPGEPSSAAISFDEFNRALGLDAYRDLEARYRS
ncbi:isocitrate lyase/PEP mutase family protein [Aquisalimonas lutea]|uniref:isocitrate lyase/PEP mutase family protein n=1 Tax=Aquisalimonas lutea TaxID=1327750 RepID=UPI0025B3A904|nr:isocitrate lyase/PEP mutase family protein [Aquisalimonas lutea]MDN3519565.1 isocitrate lyase/PEP mutase family protein [Aquisalimonas lutea]